MLLLRQGPGFIIILVNDNQVLSETSLNAKLLAFRKRWLAKFRGRNS